MNTRVLQIVLLVSVVWLSAGYPVTAQTNPTSKPKTQAKVVYVCPMHPDVRSTKRGKCPKCGMALRRTTTVVAEVPPETNPVDPVADPSIPKTESYSFSATKIP
ncbi:MAG TPA: heavy metal-binding domain-containing protein, partial [Pyrinomonadaceae bacterium]|nr:heavy metal-binding domain-containing protein [Pyrinomonadaceae bacterium]